MTASTSALEQEAERHRAEMAETAEKLRAKLTPGQLIDEVAHTLRDGDWSQALANLKTQVRDNPLALGLVGAGVACLMWGSPARPSPATTYHAPAGSRMTAAAGSIASSRAAADAAGAAAGSVADGVSNAAHALADGVASAGDRASSAAAAMKDGVASGMSGVSDAAHTAADRTRDAVRSMEREASAIIEREPLVLGAVGMAIGAALGALLPQSAFEEKHLGETEERLRDGAVEAGRGAMRKAADVAEAVGAAALSEADKQGLVPDGDAAPIAERLGKVAERSIDEARNALSEKDDAAERP